MKRISDKKLGWLIEGCQENKECDCVDLATALQELKERREADHVADASKMMPLDIKDQLRLVRDKCPGVWRICIGRSCPCDCKLTFVDDDAKSCESRCRECWDKAIEEDKK